MNSVELQGKRGSAIVTVVSALAMAVGFLAFVFSFLPVLGERLAVLLSLPGILGGFMALAIAYARNTQLIAPVLAILICAAPASLKSWREARTVWVESDQICKNPRARGGRSLIGLVAGVAMAADYRNALGGYVCGELGLQYDDYDCDGPVGRMKCAP